MTRTLLRRTRRASLLVLAAAMGACASDSDPDYSLGFDPDIAELLGDAGDGQRDARGGDGRDSADGADDAGDGSGDADASDATDASDGSGTDSGTPRTWPDACPPTPRWRISEPDFSPGPRGQLAVSRGKRLVWVSPPAGAGSRVLRATDGARLVESADTAVIAMGAGWRVRGSREDGAIVFRDATSGVELGRGADPGADGRVLIDEAGGLAHVLDCAGGALAIETVALDPEAEVRGITTTLGAGCLDPRASGAAVVSPRVVAVAAPGARAVHVLDFAETLTATEVVFDALLERDPPSAQSAVPVVGAVAGGAIVTVDEAGRVRRWSRAGAFERELVSVAPGVRSSYWAADEAFAFAGDGSLLAYTALPGLVRVLDPDGAELAAVRVPTGGDPDNPTLRVHRMGLARDGQTLAVAHSGGLVLYGCDDAGALPAAPVVSAAVIDEADGGDAVTLGVSVAGSAEVYFGVDVDGASERIDPLRNPIVLAPLERGAHTVAAFVHDGVRVSRAEPIALTVE
jgi:hypothetical protein